MNGDPDKAARFEEVDRTTAAWQQGDCVLGEHWFVSHVDPAQALTDESKNASSDEHLVERSVEGLAILTQTCDLVRSSADRPYMELAPLVRVSPERMNDIQRGRSPRYAAVPTLSEMNLVIDLDRTMTAEKSLLLRWKRMPGCTSDAERRALAIALARKRARFAFPDSFTEFIRPLAERIREKHNRSSTEGKLLRALREIRVRASPDWDADQITIDLYFILDDEVNVNDEALAEQIREWLKRLPEDSGFEAFGTAAMLDDLTARDYVESDPLDLDHLSLMR